MAKPFMRSRLAVVWLTSLACIASGARVEATTVVAKSFTELCAEADLIFNGTVADVRSEWSDAERDHIETIVIFRVSEPLFGTSAPTVTLRFSGGTLDGVREEFIGVPRFTPGEHVVLFARRGREVSPIVGLSQGCFRVVETADGPAMAAADGQLLTALERGDTGDGGRAAGDAPLSLPHFLDAVRGELDAQGRGH
jgi:hypothetical protein